MTGIRKNTVLDPAPFFYEASVAFLIPYVSSERTLVQHNIIHHGVTG